MAAIRHAKEEELRKSAEKGAGNLKMIAELEDRIAAEQTQDARYALNPSERPTYVPLTSGEHFRVR